MLGKLGKGSVSFSESDIQNGDIWNGDILRSFVWTKVIFLERNLIQTCSKIIVCAMKIYDGKNIVDDTLFSDYALAILRWLLSKVKKSLQSQET